MKTNTKTAPRQARPSASTARPTLARTTAAATREKEEVRFEDREYSYVYAVAMKYLKNEDEAADVAQDALLNAFRHQHTFRGDSRFSTWLYRVAATTALMHLRKKRRARTIAMQDLVTDSEGNDPIAELEAPGSSPEELYAAAEAMDLAGKRLAELGEKYGPIFQMRFADGYSESEIADRLHLNVATVKTRAYRARAALREELAAVV